MKKLFAILTIFSILISCSTLNFSAAEKEEDRNYWISEEKGIDPSLLPGEIVGVLGDVDANGNVNIKDATAVQKHVAGITAIKKDFLVLANADLSSDINVKDATAIQKWLAAFPIDYYIGHYVYVPYAVDKNVIGTWETSINAAGLINEMLSHYSNDPLFLEHVNIEDFVISESYTFNADGTYLLTVDENIVSHSAVKLKKELEGDMSNYLEAYADEHGYFMTADQMLILMGYDSMTDFLDHVFPLDLLLSTLKPSTGYYRAVSGKLYIDEFSGDFYEFYTIDDDALTIYGNNKGTLADEYPITYYRVQPETEN